MRTIKCFTFGAFEGLQAYAIAVDEQLNGS